MIFSLSKIALSFQDADQDHQAIRCLDPTRTTTWQEVDRTVDQFGKAVFKIKLFKSCFFTL
jgi:hypothetical protein